MWFDTGMTMTESSPEATRNGRGRSTDETPALTDQIVLSGAGVASQTLTTALRVADGAVTAVDTLVLGAFDIAEQLAASSLVAELAAKGVDVSRQAWSAAVATTREALAGL